ncbi:hypothetical protein LCGC14_1165270 [marine sediment metagenome]|uniref:Uncharacterized protein n=1 Tax=marine sediment metagenome TaxID=412755 RepID=A0A0F9LRJ0_9ZZZZ
MKKKLFFRSCLGLTIGLIIGVLLFWLGRESVPLCLPPSCTYKMTIDENGCMKIFDVDLRPESENSE